MNVNKALLILLLIGILGCSTYSYKGIQFADKESYVSAVNYSLINFERPFDNFIPLAGDDKTFIRKYELTKREYDIFLNDIKDIDPKLCEESQIDYEAWKKSPHFGSITNDHMVSSYHHPGYDMHPIVNITYQGARNYCKWATQQIKSKYKKKIINVRLPTETEYDSIISYYKINIRTDTLDFISNTEYNFNANLTYYINNLHVNEIQTAPMLLDRSFNQTYVFKYLQTKDGLCSIIGNVSEMIDENRVYGGNWHTVTDELHKPLTYTYPDPRIGFRLVLEVLN